MGAAGQHRLQIGVTGGRAHLQVGLCLAMTFNLELCDLTVHVEVPRGMVATHFSFENMLIHGTAS
jgi:hypothetical protein